MNRTLREMDRPYRKWIVPQRKEIVQQGNGLFIKEMDRTLWKWIVPPRNWVVHGMCRTSREMDRN